MSEHYRITASCVYLWILRSFSEHSFMEHLHIQVAEFRPADTVKKLFHRYSQAFYTRTKSSHSKAFIYLKFLKTISSCDMPTCNFTNKSLSYILLHVFYFAFIFSEPITNTFGFESVRAQFLSGNISEKECSLQFTCSVTIHLSQLFPCWIWHLILSWVRFLSNKLEFFLCCNTKITRTSFFLLSLCVFDMYFFIKT